MWMVVIRETSVGDDERGNEESEIERSGYKCTKCTGMQWGGLILLTLDMRP